MLGNDLQAVWAESSHIPHSRSSGNGQQGTNLRGLVQAAERLGFTAKAVKGDQNALLSDFPLPAIAHVLVDGRLLHYVVIHKITKKRILVADPAKGMVKYTPEDFFKIWTGVLVIMIPSEAFKKEMRRKARCRGSSRCCCRRKDCYHLRHG